MRNRDDRERSGGKEEVDVCVCVCVLSTALWQWMIASLELQASRGLGG